MTEIKCFLSQTEGPVHEGHPIWSTPFPLHRNSESDKPVESPLSYGDYYTGVRAFLEKDKFRFLTEAIYRQTKSSVRDQDIQAIHIHLEKHGAFYHPARIAVRFNGQEIFFVLNVAISHTGKTTICREYALLKRLGDEFPWPYLPTAYALDTVSGQGGRIEMIMFLGEWFEGFHEFHLSGCRTGGKTEIVLWDEANGYRKLPQHMVLPLFRKAAEILTAYYNVCSFEQICSWHHAAGDFILSVCGSRLDMRLISVRQYASITDNTHTDPESMAQSMMVFLLNLSLRMRVDRIDGIGELIWADDRAVTGTVKGFVDGMSQKARTEALAEPVTVLFRDYAASFTSSDLFDTASALVDSYPPQAPETDLIRKHLNRHCSTLYDALRHCIN